MGFLHRLFNSGPDKDLVERMGRLEKRWDAIEMEWSEWFGKFRLLYQRISKRAKEEARREEAAEAADNDGDRQPTLFTPASTLSTRAQLIQKQIEARRRAITKGGSE